MGVSKNSGKLSQPVYLTEKVDLSAVDIEIGAVEIKDGTTDTRAEVTASNEVKVLASAQPGVDVGDVTVNNAAGASAVNIQDGGNSITVDAVDLDIRDLTNATDSVAIYGSDDGGTTKRIIKTDVGGAIQVDLEVANVTVDNAAGASAVNIQDGGNSITIDATSLPLPTGAATAANQLADGHNVTVDNAAGGAAVNIQDGGNSITVDGTVTSTPSGTQDVNNIQLNGVAISVDSGITGTGVQRVVLATDVALPAGTNLIGKVGIDQVTANANEVVTKTGSLVGLEAGVAEIGNVKNSGTFATQATLQAGTAEIGKLAAGVAEIGNVKNSGTFAVQSTLQTGANVIGQVSIDQTTPGTTNLVQTKEEPDATSTFAPSSDLSGALEASSVSKASAGVVYGLSGHNTLASAQWLLIFNSATVPANGAVTPIAAIRIAGNSNFSFDTGKFGIYCSAGISWCNSTDATIFNKTLGAADCFVNLLYK